MLDSQQTHQLIDMLRMSQYRATGELPLFSQEEVEAIKRKLFQELNVIV